MLYAFVGFIFLSNPFLYLFTMLLSTCSRLRSAIASVRSFVISVIRHHFSWLRVINGSVYGKTECVWINTSSPIDLNVHR